MSFKTFMSILNSMTVAGQHNQDSRTQQAAARVKMDSDFPAGDDYDVLLQYVKTNSLWMRSGALNDFKEAYSIYASAFNKAAPPLQTYSDIEANKPEHFNTLPPEEKQILLDWISTELEPFRTKGYHSRRDSYRMKHSFQFSNVGFYITEGQFKGAMLASDFYPKDYEADHWHFTLGKHAGITVV